MKWCRTCSLFPAFCAITCFQSRSRRWLIGKYVAIGRDEDIARLAAVGVP
jgi:hypothetical protein